MANALDDLIARGRPVIYDGATGTLLQQYGLPLGQAPESWVLDQPASVFAAAEAYVNAGAQIILTCTFGGTAMRLHDAGLEAQAFEINRRAAELAKDAAKGHALVAGSMGPLGRMPLALGLLSKVDAVEQYADQARALADGGVDLFQVESMSDLAEMLTAIKGIRRVSALPICATMSFESNRRTLLGITPTSAAKELVQAHVAAIGANCGHGPEDMVSILSEMSAAEPDAVLIAKPNAGLPELRDGKAVYAMEPARFAAYARTWVELGAKIVGGCCGTTPQHIAAIRTAFEL